MKVAIMQPYFFPYIGYFQLINIVDVFVVFDDVNYIKKGWINRNRILINGESSLFSLSLQKASQNKLINEIFIYNDTDNKNKLVKKIKHAYAKAPYFKSIFPLLEEIILYDENNFTIYVKNSIEKIKDFLDIDTKLLFSSEIDKNNELKGQEKIIDICKNIGADNYINPIGRIELYSKQEFKKNSIKLNFIKSKNIKYKQFDNEFVPQLSIIDLLMFNSKEEIKGFLERYELL